VQMRGKAAKTASYQIVEATTEEKNTALLLIAGQLIKDQASIIDANKKDVENGRENGLDKSVVDRIMLNEERIEAMANAIKRSEEHTSELQSRFDLVCRLLLEKKK